FADALDLLAADVAAGQGEEARKLFKEAFHGREQRQLGLYVLLAAAGQNLDSQNLDVLAEHPDEPLAQYLALHSSPVLRKHASQGAVLGAQWGEGFLQQLAVSHALLQRWLDPRALGTNSARRRAEFQRAAEHVRRHRNSPFGWALLSLMQAAISREEPDND